MTKETIEEKNIRENNEERDKVMNRMRTIKPEDALEIIKEASEALSHASYCAITGMRVSGAAITERWDNLRLLIEALDPKHAHYFWPQGLTPTLVISTTDSFNNPEEKITEREAGGMNH